MREWVVSHAQQGYDSIKFLVSNDDVFVEGGSMMTQFDAEELNAAGEAAREAGVWLNGHCQSPESVKLAVKAGFRSIYHCTYADEEALDLLESAKDTVFVSPAAGIIYANVHEGEEFGITREVAQKMGSLASFEGMQAIYPEIRKRGVRALIGGDYGFPNNPIGRNARDLELFVDVPRLLPGRGAGRRDAVRRPAHGHGRRARSAQGRLPRRRPRGQGRPDHRRHRAAGRRQHHLHPAERRASTSPPVAA